MNPRLDQNAVAKVSGPLWAPLRETFLQLSDALLSVHPEAFGELTTIYVKYQVSVNAAKQVYAVAWIRKSSEIVVGLALPQDYPSPILHSAPKGREYPKLTRYFTIKSPADLPSDLTAMASAALDEARSS